MVVENWWHYAATPDGPYAHQLDPTALAAYIERECATDPELSPAHAEAEACGLAAEEIRAALNFPPNGRWVARSGWDSGLSRGEPHPNYLKACRDAGHEPGSWPLP